MSWLQESTGGLLLLCAAAIAVLLALIIVVKLEPFIALLIAGFALALAAGLPVSKIVGTALKASDSVLETGFGGILGHIAVIVGLGTVLGAILERSGGADVLVEKLTGVFGERGAPIAMGLAGLIFGIPVFFDIGIFVLAPLVYVAALRGGRSLALYALPMLAGLSMTHAFLPPHPGPTAAAGLLGVSLGWVILIGVICGLPAFAAAGIAWPYWIGPRIRVEVPAEVVEAEAKQPVTVGGGSSLDAEASSTGGSVGGGSTTGGSGGGVATAERPSGGVGDSADGVGDGTGVDRDDDLDGGSAAGRPAEDSPAPSATVAGRRPVGLGTVLGIILVPLVLILGATFGTVWLDPSTFLQVLTFLGNPAVALTIAVLLAFWLLGVRRGSTVAELSEVTANSLRPVGMILLVVGAGAFFGKVISSTGVGDALAGTLSDAGLPIIVLAYLISCALRLAQGSATVALVTTGGIIAPLVQNEGYSPAQLATLVIAISAGSIIASHVNDGGFWIISRYFNMSVKQTLATWTVLETILSIVGFVMTLIVWALL
ncbi:GntP family permease [Cryptosporangium sp. NPDC048952]|uniref:GntP family permease n=1 Tax=Cryptosporangium sp. NPDC048952 TaxID=3363961 RepID=UPI00371CFA11